jgi:hypothetical protein
MGELHFIRCDLHLIELSIENKKKWTLKAERMVKFLELGPPLYNIGPKEAIL